MTPNLIRAILSPDFIKAIASLLWPIIVLISVYKLWPYILKLTKEATQVKIKIGDYELSASGETSEIFIKPIINELTDAVATLLPEQKNEFRKIYNQVCVEGREFQLPSEFQRDSEYHSRLRALRNVYFIRPVGGGRWQAGKQVEVKNFGKLAAKLKTKELGF